MLEGLEYVSNLITRYAIVEELYLSKSSVAIHQLSNSIVKFYSSILSFLGKAPREEPYQVGRSSI
jgi:hypothetical protein